jgi:hypothetical protein
MKTLKLKALALGAAEVLTREQMKNVIGAYMLPGCTNDCGGTSGTCSSGTCKSVACSDDTSYFHNVCA